MFSFSCFSDASPYPPLKVERQNLTYAREMLLNIGSCDSEMSAVASYRYNSTILWERQPEIAQIFHKISMVEMRHLNSFTRLAFLLGCDPRLWTDSGRRPCYWSPACISYPARLEVILKNALQGEKNAIAAYRRQAEFICDAYVTDVLNRVILDEQIHCQIFTELLSEMKNPEEFM